MKRVFQTITGLNRAPFLTAFGLAPLKAGPILVEAAPAHKSHDKFDGPANS